MEVVLPTRSTPTCLDFKDISPMLVISRGSLLTRNVLRMVTSLITTRRAKQVTRPCLMRERRRVLGMLGARPHRPKSRVGRSVLIDEIKDLEKVRPK